MNNREAVIVVDYQNDFANPEWSLYVKWWEKIVWYINSVMQEIKSKSWIIITSQDWHPENHISFAKTYKLADYSLKDWEMKWPSHCVTNTWWADFLEWFNKDLVDRKVLKWYEENIDSYSSFWWIDMQTKETLEQILKSYNTQVLHIVWLATEYCDLATVQSARNLWFEVVLHIGWIAAVNVNPDDEKKAIQEMMRIWAKIID